MACGGQEVGKGSKPGLSARSICAHAHTPVMANSTGQEFPPAGPFLSHVLTWGTPSPWGQDRAGLVTP